MIFGRDMGRQSESVDAGVFELGCRGSRFVLFQVYIEFVLCHVLFLPLHQKESAGPLFPQFLLCGLLWSILLSFYAEVIVFLDRSISFIYSSHSQYLPICRLVATVSKTTT